MTITATEFKTNLGKYLDLIATGYEEIYITKNGKEYAKLSNPNRGPLEALDKLVKLANSVNVADIDVEKLKEERLEERYGIRFDR